MYYLLTIMTALFFLILIKTFSLISANRQFLVFKKIARYGYQKIEFFNDYKYSVIKNKSYFKINNSLFAKKKFKSLYFNKRNKISILKASIKLAPTINKNIKANKIYFINSFNNKYDNYCLFFDYESRLYEIKNNNRIVHFFGNTFYLKVLKKQIVVKNITQIINKNKKDIKIDITLKYFVSFINADYSISKTNLVKFSHQGSLIKIKNKAKSIKVNDLKDNILIKFAFKNNIKISVLQNDFDINLKYNKVLSEIRVVNDTKKVYGNVFNVRVYLSDKRIENLLNDYLPNKIINNFKKSSETNLFNFVFFKDIKSLNGFSYNATIDWLLKRQEYERLYSYLLKCVLGFNFLGDRILFFESKVFEGKIKISFNDIEITKYNLQSGFYFVFNNIIYKNVGMLHLSKIKELIISN